eukprot:scaffold3572_cov113-Cylindrotheca_fusiformis.AAC.7
MQFKGEAQVKWQTGKAENRKDHDGKWHGIHPTGVESQLASGAEEAGNRQGSTILYEGNKVNYVSCTYGNRHYSMGPRVRLVPHQDVSLNKNTGYRIAVSVYPSFYGGVTERRER